MDAIVVWDSWIALVEPSYHSQARGRHVRAVKTMLRMYLLQVMFGLSRRGNLKMLSWIVGPHGASVHLDLMSEQVPDATTLAKFRHSLKAAGTRQSYASRPEFRT
jgi:IS5 family transposase